MNAAATLIAGFGLLQNSPAVIIGAMLIAMLFGPIVGIALALAEANVALLGRSLVAEIAGAALVLMIGYAVGLTSHNLSIGSEVLSRTSPNLLDLLIGLVGGAVSVPMWMHRAFRNLPALGAQGLRWSPAWAAGAWFIPIANLFVPYHVMKELWPGSDGEPLLVRRWWAAWIAAYALQVASNQLARYTRVGGDVTGILNDVVTVAAGVLLILVIRRIRSSE